MNQQDIDAKITQRAAADARAARRQAFALSAAHTYHNGKLIMLKHDRFNRSGDVYFRKYGSN